MPLPDFLHAPLQRGWRSLKSQVWPVLILIGILWAVEAWNTFAPDNLELRRFGIHPRQWSGVPGIVLGAFLHEGLWHLVANTIPLFVLGWLVAVSGRVIFLQVVVVTTLSGGLGSWLFGTSDVIHLGASGIIMGLLGFLLARGWVARRLGWSIISLSVATLYLGSVLSLLRPEERVSWSCHFWGFMGGVGLAWWLYRHHDSRFLNLTATSPVPEPRSMRNVTPVRAKKDTTPR